MIEKVALFQECLWYDYFVIFQVVIKINSTGETQMNENDKIAFYYGAAIFKDLESDQVDKILEAEGLHVDLHTAAQCVEAVNKYLHYTPAGPVADMDAVNEKHDKLKGN